MSKNIIIRDIDPELHRALKIKAAEEDITMQDLIKEALKQLVKQKKTK